MRYQDEVEFIFDHLIRADCEIIGFKSEDGEWILYDDGELAYQVCNHEEAWVITRVNGKRRGIFFVCGNEPGVIVCDYTVDRAIMSDADDPIWNACDALGQYVRELEEAVELLENAGLHVSN
tara:strand:+ start:253 stop:618 length:366 start_codon:yes stop_codon:yes gene_type:complete